MKNRWLTIAGMAFLAACIGIPATGLAGYLAPGATWQDEEKKEDSQEDDDKEKTPREKFLAIQKELADAMNEFRKAYAEAENDEDRQKVFEDKYPKPGDFADRMMDLAKAHADDDVAFDALSWVVMRVREGNSGDQALKIILTDHLDNEKLGEMIPMLAYKPPSEETREAIENVMKNSPHENVKGLATMTLADYLKRSGSKNNERILELYETVVNKYGDIKVRSTTLGKRAEGALFEMKNLQIGMVAPNINGSDLDGIEFDLEDYRGKIVVLDFWGDW